MVVGQQYRSEKRGKEVKKSERYDVSWYYSRNSNSYGSIFCISEII